MEVFMFQLTKGRGVMKALIFKKSILPILPQMYHQFDKKCLSVVLIAGLICSQLILSASLHAQSSGKGIVSGMIVDKENGSPLIGANVFISGTSLGAATDLQGSFRITSVPPGMYSVKASYMGYESIEITEVAVKAGEVTSLNFSLGMQVIEGKEVVVTAKAVRNTEALLLKDRQKAAAVSDAISVEAMSQAGAGDAASAMKQVTGASVMGGNEVLIRGLGDRYTSTMINGAEMPSTNPYKRAGSIDLIPTNLLDNIVTLKSFTPDKPGNFSGGAVDIETKDFPESFQLSFSTSSSYNTKTTLASGALAAPTGGTDWLGFDDGSRAIPDFVGDDYTVIDVAAGAKDTEVATFIDQYTKSFNPIMAPTSRTAPPNYNFAFSVGNQFELLGRPLGYMASVTYNRNQTVYEDGVLRRWALETRVSGSSALENIYDFNDRRSVDEVVWGSMAKVSYKLAPQHIVSLTGLYNRNGSNEARYLSGTYPYDLADDWTYETRVLHYNERRLSNFQLDGDHLFPTLLGTKLSWKASYADSKQDEPDVRYFTNIITSSGTYNIRTNIPQERYWRYMDEDRLNAQVDLSIPFWQWSDQEGAFKFGGSTGDKHRRFKERRFIYRSDSDMAEYLQEAEGDINAVFDESHLGKTGVRVAPNGNEYHQFGIVIEESLQESSNYTGDQSITATYAMLDLPIVKRLRFIGGARYETTDMTVVSDNEDLEEGKVKTDDVLPSANLIFAIEDNMNVRAAYGRTLARPSFREVSSFTSYDFVGGDQYIGNPDLKRTLINNFDLRWEWFPRPGEIFAISGFFKKFKDPIEQVILDTNYWIQWQNVDQAETAGLEFEMRKRLDIFGSAFRNFSFGSNLSLIYSRVDIGEDELEMVRLADPNAKDHRTFQGQSPYLLNLNLNYDNIHMGLSASIYYNRFGERLAAVGKGVTPDIYEQPADLLNLSVSKRLGNQISMKFAAKNILDSEQKRLHTFKGADYIANLVRMGRTFSLSFKYDI